MLGVGSELVSYILYENIVNNLNVPRQINPLDKANALIVNPVDGAAETPKEEETESPGIEISEVVKPFPSEEVQL